jgi:hypothetical protein
MVQSLPRYVDEHFQKAQSLFIRVVWTIIFMALAIGLFGDFFFGTAEGGVLPRALFWTIISPLWLTYLVHKANELDTIPDDLHDETGIASWTPAKTCPDLGFCDSLVLS